MLCCAVLLSCSQICVTAVTQPDATGDTVKVNFLFAFFRSEPNMSFVTIKSIFLYGREVEVLGYSGSYVRVWDSDSKSEGYIHYLLLNDKPLNIRQQYVNVYNGATKSNAVTVNYDKYGELEWSASSSGIVEIIKNGKRSFSVKGISPGTVTLTVKCGNDKDTCSITCINEWKDRETSTAKSNVKVMCAPGKYFSPEKVISEGATITVCGDIPNSDYFYVSSGDIWGYIYSSDFPDIKYMMTQYHYYDEGYQKRFGSASTKIADYASVLNDVMMANFGLKVCSYVEPYTSLADDCKILTYGKVDKNNLSKPCPHKESCLVTTHIRDDMWLHKGKGNQTVTKCIWTGHIMDSHKSDRSHSESTTQTVIFTTGNTVYSGSYTNKPTSDVRNLSLYEIVHETSHQLSAIDHYCYGKTDSDLCKNPNCETCYGSGTLPNCIMGKIIYPTDTYDLYCIECENTIENHLKEHR